MSRFSEAIDSIENRYLLLLVISGFSLVLYKILFTQRGRPLPPGPPKKFISGHYDLIPKQQAWLTYATWAKVYGPILHLRVFSEDIIVLNTSKSILDLLESRATIYSDRPEAVMIRQVAKRTGSIFQMPYDDPRFRKYRKLLHSGLNPRAVQSYRAIQTKEVDTLLQGLAETPEDFIPHLRRNAGALILKVTYGYEVSKDNDDFVKKVEEAFAYSARKLNQPFIVDLFPILRFLPSWLPFVQFQKVAKEIIESIAVEVPPYEWAKNVISSGSYVESFISRLLVPEEGPAPDAEEEDIIKWCCAALYIGGADTTVSAMTSFFKLMTLYPDVQARAQKDIDAITGTDRLPTLDDQKVLPYITALIKEVVRWAPVVPLGLRHRVMEEDIYEGYRIPKGSTVIPNIWAITHDPDLYPDPDVFDPERHLGDSPQPDPFKFIFGFGRRVCPGAHLAEQSLFLTISSIIAVFDLRGVESENGKNPPIEWTGAIVNHMKPFPCRISLRVPHLVASLHRSA